MGSPFYIQLCHPLLFAGIYIYTWQPNTVWKLKNEQIETVLLGGHA
jgi:hypothetical protein